MEYSNFNSYLEADEYILWQGKPERVSFFRKESIFTIPFGLFFFVFACFWCFGASAFSPFFALFGLPFMAVGLYVAFGSSIHRAIVLSSTEYAITNKKLIRVSKNRVDTVRAENIGELKIEMHSNGTGTITFMHPELYAPRNYYRVGRWYKSYPDGDLGFHSIENVKDPTRVQQRINEMER